MPASDDPVALLPLAVAGIVIGAGLAVGCGYGLHLRWSTNADVPASTAQATLEGRIASADWRASAAPGGPDWYLQLRLADHPRDFLVAASSLSDRAHRRYGIPTGGAPDPDRRIPALEGKPARVVVDSSLLAQSESHPYLSGLRVEGETIVPLSEHAGGAPGWGDWAVALLLGTGVLVGLGILAMSLQHLVVCVRYRGGIS